MSLAPRVLLGAAAGAAILALSAITASAAIVCSGNVCWHVHERYDYPPSAGVVIHEDDWRPGPSITFREHEGRGFWRDDRWEDWKDYTNPALHVRCRAACFSREGMNQTWDSNPYARLTFHRDPPRLVFAEQLGCRAASVLATD